MIQKLLTPPEGQPKTRKSLKLKVRTYALHLAPADLSGNNVCPMATEGCKAACLNTAGMGIFNTVQAARIKRTNFYFEQRDAFMLQLYREISNALAKSKRLRMKLAVRLNATSDIPWERIPVRNAFHDWPNIMAAFPQVQFYDYTKIAARMTRRTMPANYHLTFSLAENNAIDAHKVLLAGGNVAVVFRTRAIVESLLGKGWAPLGSFPMGRRMPVVIDGDATDARFMDKGKGAIVALYAKGKAKTDQSGFVREV